MQTKFRMPAPLFAVLSLVLVGCFTQPFPLRSISVFTDNEGDTCLGGLKTELERNDKVFYTSATVPIGTSLQDYPDFGNDVGSPSITVTIRAWCYNAQGNEIGYAERANATLGAGSASETALLTVKPQADIEITGCETDSRGEPICLL